MGLLKRLGFSRASNSSGTRKRSIFSLVPISEVTEASLQVWRNLPPTIRQDPSMISFQQENERYKAEMRDGSQPEIVDEDIVPYSNEPYDDDNDDDYDEDSSGIDNTEFITIKVTNTKGVVEKQEVDEIKEHKVTKKEEKKVESEEIVRRETSPKTDDHHEDHNQKPFHKYGKMIFLFLVWFFITAVLTYQPEKEIKMKQLTIPIRGQTKYYFLPRLPTSTRVGLNFEGGFLKEKFNNRTENYLTIYLQSIISEDSKGLHEWTTDETVKNISEVYNIPVTNPELLEMATPIKKNLVVNVVEENLEFLKDHQGYIRIVMKSNFFKVMPIKIRYDHAPVNIDVGVIYAAFALIFLYGLIIWEIVHRAFAAVLASSLSIAILAALHDRPTVAEIIAWIDVETILLLFTMMILVGILTETGVFGYLAVFAYKLCDGKIWTLIHALCIITALVSSFLDNVTTVLLMAPITIRLCEEMDLNPVPVLFAIVVHANIGGTTTPIGDPPNVIITSNHYILEHGVTFLTFTAHMVIGVIIVLLTTSLHIRLRYRDVNKLVFHEPKEIKILRRNIAVWERAAASISPFSKDANLVRETLLKKVKILRHQLKKKLAKGSLPVARYKATLEEMQKTYPIKNKPLLLKSGIAFLFIIALFFIESFPAIHRLSLGWSALIGVILLLIISDKNDMDVVLSRVEWATLLFFAAMFVLMEAIERLGFIAWIGQLTESVIMAVSEQSRLAVAIIIILWVSAMTSAFVDSIPVTTMMVKVVITLSENTMLALPLQPLVWALAFGPCLGGNGTLVGASANVICAGIAEQHGYKFSFVEYFKVGFPIMIVSVIVTTAYLLVAHCIFTWH